MPSPQIGEHSSPATSQAQPASSMQVALQPSPAVVLPSSQVSTPGETLPSPHLTVETQGEPGVGQAKLASICRQFAVQPSPDSVLPSSHFSSAWLIFPSPQTAGTRAAASPHTLPSQSIAKGSMIVESPRLIMPVPPPVPVPVPEAPLLPPKLMSASLPPAGVTTSGLLPP